MTAHEGTLTKFTARRHAPVYQMVCDCGWTLTSYVSHTAKQHHLQHQAAEALARAAAELMTA